MAQDYRYCQSRASPRPLVGAVVGLERKTVKKSLFYRQFFIPKGDSKYLCPLPSASEIPSNMKYSLLTSDGCHRALSDRFRCRWWDQWWGRSRTGWWGQSLDRGLLMRTRIKPLTAK